MKTAIVYVSTHHGNTKKLAEAIAEEYGVALIDGTEESAPDLADYDCIGFASGIAYYKFYHDMLDLMEACLPEGKKVFFLYTCGIMRPDYTKLASETARRKNCVILGEYGCLGFDTYGPFGLMGGIAKGHPDDAEIRAAVEFFRGITENADSGK